MEGFPYSKALIHDEFQRMKTIREIALDDDIIAFLEMAHASLKANGATNPQGPFKRPLLHYAAWEIAPSFFVICFRMVQR